MFENSMCHTKSFDWLKKNFINSPRNNWHLYHFATHTLSPSLPPSLLFHNLSIVLIFDVIRRFLATLLANIRKFSKRDREKTFARTIPLTDFLTAMSHLHLINSRYFGCFASVVCALLFSTGEHKTIGKRISPLLSSNPRKSFLVKTVSNQQY